MAITYANFANELRPGLNRVFNEVYNSEVKMVIDAPRTITPITPVITDNNITWTAAGSDTSTITDSIIYNDTSTTFDRGNITVRFTDNDIIRTEEDPPKTYLQLPTGKRLISI